MTSATGSEPPPDRTAEFQSALTKHVQRERRRFERLAQGIAPRHCPLCQYYGKFGPFGMPPRFDALCPSCNGLERHRLILLTLQRRGLLDSSHALLHFAAERVLSRHLRGMVGRYVTAEINAAKSPDLVLDVEAIDLPDHSFDRIMCNHVIEHVDDRKALAEMFRILKPGGILILTTPVVEGWAESYENPAITSRDGQFLHFGQADHLRIYGRDLRHRIAAAGFALTESVAAEPDVRTFGLMRGETVFLCTRPAEAQPVRG